jgi:hypothetical protein
MTRFEPGLLLLLLGVVFGPQGINLLSPGVLSFVDPALPVALVAIGILATTRSAPVRISFRRVMAAGGVQALTTAAAVVAATLAAARFAAWEPALPMWLIALALGSCAAAAGALPASDSGQGVGTSGDRLGNLFAIGAAGVGLVLLREPTLAGAASLFIQSSLVALVIALAAWLLINRSRSPAEQRIFSASLLLLLGGAADYLSLSALLSGIIAAVFLRRMGGPARDAVGRAVLSWHHPLIALVLIVAGAMVAAPGAWLAVAAVYLFARTAGAAAGRLAAQRIAAPAATPPFDMGLASPGIVAIALALTVLRAAGPAATALLGIVVVATICARFIGGIVGPGRVIR